MAFRVFWLLASILLACTQASANPDTWRWQGWKTDFSKLSVDPREVMNGGPPRDGIPPIDDPKFVSVAKGSHLTDREPVIGLTIDGDARAYPLQVMTWHEIVNDNVGGIPVAVTYCPLCNAAIVFDARVDGKALTFGTTGKLRKSDLIMYDRSTDSWWQQFVGTGIAGEYNGKKLKMLPARLESWKAFKTRHPEGKVLVPNNPGMRNYGKNPYVGYDVSARPFLYSGSMPEGISPMARVVVVRTDDTNPLVIAMDAIRQAGSMSVSGFAISWQSGQASALDSPEISKGRDVGSITVQRDGVDVPYDVTFAFVAHAFHPDATIRKN